VARTHRPPEGHIPRREGAGVSAETPHAIASAHGPFDFVGRRELHQAGNGHYHSQPGSLAGGGYRDEPRCPAGVTLAARTGR
jgi:hypothetical protein